MTYCTSLQQGEDMTAVPGLACKSQGLHIPMELPVLQLKHLSGFQFFPTGVLAHLRLDMKDTSIQIGRKPICWRGLARVRHSSAGGMLGREGGTYESPDLIAQKTTQVVESCPSSAKHAMDHVKQHLASSPGVHISIGPRFSGTVASFAVAQPAPHDGCDDHDTPKQLQHQLSI